ncbi:MAG: glycogen/starch synthase, partial [Muribaculaceae bacterium]|nr:glycogen/starch synthase [Muribaculaceae bacterium]
VEDPEANDERTIFFVRGVVETVRKLRWEPSVVHCTGWITALTPLYLKHIYPDDPSFRSSKIVFSLFNDPFEGTFDSRAVEKLRAEGFSDELLASLLDGDGNVDYVKLNKIAIDYADALVVATPEVNPEVLEYAKASGKPLLEYPGEDIVGAYHEFYKTL